MGGVIYNYIFLSSPFSNVIVYSITYGPNIKTLRIRAEVTLRDVNTTQPNYDNTLAIIPIKDMIDAITLLVINFLLSFLSANIILYSLTKNF